jgi:WD40 repeat protein/serine/threonine protein kinase
MELKQAIQDAFKSKDWPKGAALLAEWCKQRPDNSKAWYYRAYFLAKMGNLSEARACAGRSLSLKPDANQEAKDLLLSLDARIRGGNGGGNGDGTDRAQGVWQEGQCVDDRYEIRGGKRGGMGEVYFAFDRKLERMVALKTPLPSVMAKEEMKARFFREAEAWIGLGIHPNICSAYYVRELEGVPRLFIEYVEGGSLDQWISGNGHHSLGERLDVAIQIASGMHHTHTFPWKDEEGKEHTGLVHRDLKPANILMDGDGTARVTDFGLVGLESNGPYEDPHGKGRQTGPHASDGTPNEGDCGGHRPEDGSWQTMTVADSALGTPPYMAPEQWTAAHEAGIPADIYAYGCVLYELFCGRRPFVLDEKYRNGIPALQVYQWQKLHTESAPPHPRDLAPGLDEELAESMLACLEKDPSRRPASFQAIRERLKTLYARLEGNPYPRQEAKASTLMGAALNNQGISFMTLGQANRAEAAWRDALAAQPHHPEASYNLNLFLWRKGRITDGALIKELEEVRRSHEADWIDEYLLAQVHLERGDAEAAVLTLEEVHEADLGVREIQAALSTAWERRRPTSTFKGHGDVVNTVHLSRDGRMALSGSADHTLKLWETETGLCVRTFTGHENAVTSAVLSHDGKRAFSGSWNGELMLWEAASGRLISKLSVSPAVVHSVAIRADGRLGVSGGGSPMAGNLLQVWDLEEGRCLRSLNGHGERVVSISMSGDGRLALSGSWDKTLKLWDLEKGVCLRTFDGNARAVESVSLSPDGRLGVSGCADGSLSLWEIETGRCLRTLQAHTGSVYSVDLSLDGSLALSAGGDKRVRIWELDTGRCRRTFRGHTEQVNAAILAPKSAYVISGSSDKTLKRWATGLDNPYSAPMAPSRADISHEVISLQDDYEADLRKARDALANGDPVSAAEHTRSARNRSGYSRGPEALKIWGELYLHLPRKTLDGGWEGTVLNGHTPGAAAAIFTPKGDQALSGGADKTIRLWDVASGQVIRTFEGHQGEVVTVCLSRDGRLALSGGQDSITRLWEVSSGKALGTFREQGQAVTSVALSPDNRWALSVGEAGWLTIRDTATGNAVRRFQPHQVKVTDIKMSSDGAWVFTASGDHAVKLWNFATGRCVRTFAGHTNWVMSICLSADQQRLLSGSFDKSLRLWEVTTGRCLCALEAAGGEVTSADLSADGRFALSGGIDCAVRIWDLASGRCLRTFQGHEHRISSVRFSADGRYVVSTDTGGAVRIWVLDWALEDRLPAAWAEEARPILKAFLDGNSPYEGTLPEDGKPSYYEIAKALRHSGTPLWSEDQWDLLRHTLACAGLGWLEPEGVRSELERMAQDGAGSQQAKEGPDKGEISERIKVQADLVERIILPLLPPFPPPGQMDLKQSVQMSLKVLRSVARWIPAGKDDGGTPVSLVSMGFTLFKLGHHLHDLMMKNLPTAPKQALQAALQIFRTGQQCLGEPTSTETRDFLMDTLNRTADSLELIFHRPEKAFPPSPFDLEKALDDMVKGLRGTARYLESGRDDLGAAFAPEQVGQGLLQVVQGLRTENMNQLFMYAYPTQYVEITGKFNELEMTALILLNVASQKLQGDEAPPPAQAVPTVETRPAATKVISPKVVPGAVRYAPMGCPRLTGWEGGLSLNRKDRDTVQFEAIALLSVFREGNGGDQEIKLLIFLKGQQRPYQVEGMKIQYPDFPGVASQTVQASLRNLITYLCSMNPQIVLDRGTHDFVEGALPAKAEKGALALATGLGMALGTEGSASEDGAIPSPNNEPVLAGPASSGGPMTCPKCGASNQHEPECRSCGIIFAKIQPEYITLLRLGVERLRNARRRLPATPPGKENPRQNVQGAIDVLNHCLERLKRGRDDQGAPISRPTVGIEIMTTALGLEKVMVATYGHSPSKIQEAVGVTRRAAKLLVGTSSEPELRQVLAQEIQGCAGTLDHVFRNPEIPLPKQPVDLGPFLLLASSVHFPSQANVVAKGEDNSGNKVSLEQAGEQIVQLSTSLTHGNFVLIYVHHFSSRWPEIMVSFAKLEAIGILLMRS